MFFLITNHENEQTDEKYLTRKVNGTPRIVSMCYNLGLLSPLIVITESKKIVDLLKLYNIRHEFIESGTFFEKVGQISEREGYESRISIFTPEEFLEDIDKLDGLMDVFSSSEIDLKDDDQMVMTFFTESQKIKLRNNKYILLNRWGDVTNISKDDRTNMRQVEFYVLSPKMLKNLNILQNSEEFADISRKRVFTEPQKMIYYSIPLKVMDIGVTEVQVKSTKKKVD